MADDYSANIATTGVVKIGGQTSGSIETPKDSDWFKATLQPGLTYIFELRGIRGGGGTLGSVFGQPDISLYNADGSSTYASSYTGTEGDPLIVFSPSTAGNYYLRVASTSDLGIGTYALGASIFPLLDDYGSSMPTAGALAVGDKVTGNIELPADIDWFRTTLQAGTTYLFDLRSSGSGGLDTDKTSAQPRLGLSDAQGNRLQSSYGKSGSAGSGTILSFTPSVSGDYVVTVGDSFFASVTGIYDLTLSALGQGDDYANSKSTVGVLYAGNQVTGNIETPADTDWFRVDLKEGWSYSFSLRGADASGGTLGRGGEAEPYLGLHDPHGGLLQAALHGGLSDDPMILYVAPASGSFYLEVSELHAIGTGTYTLLATETGPADDFGGSTYNAGGIVIGGQVNGNIEAAGDRDFFKVSLSEGTNYLFELRGSDSGGGTLGSGFGEAHLALYDNLGGSVLGTKDGGTSGDPLMSFMPRVSGDYYLVVSDASYVGTGSYVLRAFISPYSDDYPSSAATTGIVAVGGQSTGNLELPTDVDWFRVDLQAGTTYFFDLRDANGGGGTLGADTLGAGSMDLYDATGSTLRRATNNGLDNQPWISFMPSTAGSYYLSVKESSGVYTGTYTVMASTAETQLAPKVASYSPADGATSASNTANIVLTFSQPIQWGTGSIVLRQADGTVVETINAAGGSQLTLAGSTLTINPTADLNPGTHYYLDLSPGAVVDLAGHRFGGSTNFYDFTTAKSAATSSFSVAGTPGDDILIPTGGNNHMGGSGNDTYILSPKALAASITATIVDTEGSNIIQIVDGTVVSASSFLNDAVQLSLSTGAVVQILGASRFSFQVGANATSGDASASLSFNQFGTLLGATIPAAGGSAVSGTPNYTVPTGAPATGLEVVHGGVTIAGLMDVDLLTSY